MDKKEEVHETMFQPKQSLGKCKVKPQCDITAYLLEWLKVKRLTLPNVGKDVEQTVDGNLR